MLFLDENKVLFVRDPHLAHQAILFAMRAHPNDVNIQQSGCGTLGNLACNNGLSCFIVTAYEYYD